MKSVKAIQISVPSALKLIDVIQAQVRATDSEETKKILLRAAIKIADLALSRGANPRRISKAA
jgi:hypothetical protein